MGSPFELGAFIVGFTQVIRMMKIFPSKFLPFASTVIGGVANAVFEKTYDDPMIYVTGAFVGMTVTGIINYINNKTTSNEDVVSSETLTVNKTVVAPNSESNAE